MFFLSFLQVFGISDERGSSNVRYCFKSDIFTFADISFCLPVLQSQVKQPHLLLPFLLLTALPSSPCGHAFPGSAVLQLCGTGSLSVPVTGTSWAAPPPQAQAVWPPHSPFSWWLCLPAVGLQSCRGGAARGCLYHHSHLFQNMPPLSLS